MKPERVASTPAVVIGTGAAGLTAALGLPGVTVITKSQLGEGGSSAWAQGGIAAALSAQDSPVRRRAVPRLIASAALARQESRGAHYRRDHPEANGLGRLEIVDGSPEAQLVGVA